MATISTGTKAHAIRPSRTLMISIAISTPKNVSSELIIVTSPVCRNVESASTSDVMRVMIRPDSSRS